MRNSLYDALELSTTSSSTTIQSAIRMVLRRFWATLRGMSGDSEEAVRFAALAAAILLHPVRRKHYDATLRPGVGTGPWYLSTNTSALSDQAVEAHDNFIQEVTHLTVKAAPQKNLPGVDAIIRPLPNAVSPLGWLVVGLLVTSVLLWFACAFLIAGGSNLTSVLWQPWVLLACLVIISSIFVTSLIVAKKRTPKTKSAALSKLSIIKWRRDGSIFIGMPEPCQDTAWVFQLRLMELTRSNAGYVSLYSPLRRFCARWFDGSLLALCVCALTGEMFIFFPAAESSLVLLRSPLVLPVMIVLLMAVIESYRPQSLGKFLLGIQMVFAVTLPQDMVEPGLKRLMIRRAWTLALRGLAIGLWPLVMLRLPHYWRLMRNKETVWDAAGDVIVLAKPVTWLAWALVLLVPIAVTILLAAIWFYDFHYIRNWLS